MSREESMRIAAEKIRLKREKEAREENEMYARITSGWQWLTFKIVVVFCTLMFVLTTIEVLVDGHTKKLTEHSWKIDRNWEYDWHKVLDVKGYMFSPTINDWSDRVENSLSMTYSPIFRTGKKLNFDIKVDETITRKHSEIRENSIFTWFPALQFFLLLPLFTFIFKRQKPWFNFARIASFAIVFPGTLLVIYFSLT